MALSYPDGVLTLSLGYQILNRKLRPRLGKIGPKSAISGVGPNEQNVGKKSPDWEIRASRPLPITDTRTATAGFPAAFLGPEFDSGNRASEQSSAARSNDSDF